jgi:hypothetical protein
MAAMDYIGLVILGAMCSFVLCFISMHFIGEALRKFSYQTTAKKTKDLKCTEHVVAEASINE